MISAWLQVWCSSAKIAANLVLKLHACIHVWCAWSTRSSLTYHMNHDHNSGLPQSKHLVMHNLFFLPYHIGDMREKEKRYTTLSLSLCLCVCAHFIGMQSVAGCITRQSEIHTYSISMKHFRTPICRQPNSTCLSRRTSMALNAQVLFAAIMRLGSWFTFVSRRRAK